LIHAKLYCFTVSRLVDYTSTGSTEHALQFVATG